MEVTDGTEEAFIREWTPCTHILNLIPARMQNGLFSIELSLTCVDAVSEFIALGTNVGLVFWYDRKKGNIQRLKCENSSSAITYVKIANTVDYMVGAGNEAGQVTVFQIPKEHPENVPDNFKPKTEPKVERYTIGELHKSQVTAIEWSKNGMRLFSGDKNGVIIMTEIDFYMHLCKSMEIVNEGHEIVQISHHQSHLLVSSVYRTIVCERQPAKWRVNQIGKKERKTLCRLGAVFHHSYAPGAGGAGGPVAYCARPGLRLWRADTAGEVLQTLLFKEAVANPMTVAELLNPCARVTPGGERQLGALHVFRDHFLAAHDGRALLVLDPRSLTAVAVVDDLRRILSVSVGRDEIFVLEGGRSLVRLAHRPEPASLAAEEPLGLMTKSLTESLQHAVSAVRGRTAPLLAGVLDQPLAALVGMPTTTTAEECFEPPPAQPPPAQPPRDVLQSIADEHRDASTELDLHRRARSEELQRKLRSAVRERGRDCELIHSSRRGRRRGGGAGVGTPRGGTPVRDAGAGGGCHYTAPCSMDVSVYSNVPEPNDEDLERLIEEKEKLLAKMLNLDSLGIEPVTTPEVDYEKEEFICDRKDPEYSTLDYNMLITNKKPVNGLKNNPPSHLMEPVKTDKTEKEVRPVDLVPKVVELPNNWNLGDIELKLEMQSDDRIYKNGSELLSPDDHLSDSEWEII